MANLTITVDDELLRRARVRAAQLGTSVNAVLRAYMETWAGAQHERARAVESLLKRSRSSRSARRGRSWTRDELHER
jgi:plasmid stability protein